MFKLVHFLSKNTPLSLALWDVIAVQITYLPFFFKANGLIHPDSSFLFYLISLSLSISLCILSILLLPWPAQQQYSRNKTVKDGELLSLTVVRDVNMAAFASLCLHPPEHPLPMPLSREKEWKEESG